MAYRISMLIEPPTDKKYGETKLKAQTQVAGHDTNRRTNLPNQSRSTKCFKDQNAPPNK